ncbi:MAG: sulfotransferase family 2 domain-containing protein [Prochlorococcaceae cyanobacterium]
MPIFSKERRNILYIHIPKCGGSSLVESFRQDGYNVLLQTTGLLPQEALLASPQHLTSKSLLSLIDLNKIDEVFTIVRNPYDRLVSEYRWTQRRASKGEGGLGFEPWVIEQLRLTTLNPHHADNHLRPMMQFLSRDLPCRIFRYEAGLDAICEFYNPDSLQPPAPVGERNRSVDFWHGPSPSIQMLSQATLDLVNDFYREDFQLLFYPTFSSCSSQVYFSDSAKVSHLGALDSSPIAWQLSANEQCISVLERKVKALRAVLQAKRQKELEEFAHQLSMAASKHQYLLSEHADVIMQRDELILSRDEAAARMSEYEIQIEELTLGREELLEGKKHLEAERDAIKQERAEAEAVRETLLGRMSEYEIQIEELTRGREELLEEKKHLKAERDAIKKERAEAEAVRETLLGRMSEYEIQIEELTRGREELLEEKEHLVAECDQLRARCQATTTSLQDSQRQLDDSMDLVQDALGRLENHYQVVRSQDELLQKKQSKLDNSLNDLRWNRDRLFWYRERERHLLLLYVGTHALLGRAIALISSIAVASR